MKNNVIEAQQKGSVAEFVGNPCRNGGLTAERVRSVFRFDHGLQRHRENQTPGPRLWLEPGGMHSLQSTDGSVLRLHSCRALSPEPPTKGRLNDSTFKLLQQVQIWNGSFAYAYPYFTDPDSRKF